VKRMEQKNILRAESLIPHRRHMRLLEWVINPAEKGLQAETTVTASWPLGRDGTVSSVLCIELVAQAISALSTWRRGEGARPRVGLLVGIKEAEFFTLSFPLGTGLTIHVEELYHVGNYAVFEGQVISGSALFCTTIVQVMEPEGDDFLNLLKTRGSYSGMEERED
jgi:predicted hotdog family 3-hydroxylacyl-ACP dehydratase